MDNKPIKVLFWGMSSNIGGIETFIINVCRNIDHSKVKVDFITSHDHDKLAFEDEIVAMGGCVYRVMYSERESFVKARTSLKKFFKEHNDYKVVHVHANFHYAFILKYAKKYGVPIRILHSHNSSEGNGTNKTGIKKIISFLREKQIQRQIKKYPTEYYACSDLAAKYMFDDRAYKWIKNGVKIEKYRFSEQTRKDIRNSLNIRDDEKVLGFIGYLREQKNPLFIIDIFKEYLKIEPNAKLLMIGKGELEGQIREYAKEQIENNKVLLLGQRKDPERLYQAMDAFLLPSLFEGLPVVLVEAQAAGLQCFTSDVVTKQVNVMDRIHYYSLEMTPKYWAENINSILSNKDDRSNIESLIKQGFDIKDVAKELEQSWVND